MPTTVKKNKVKFNLKNVHIAILTKSDEGDFSYGTPTALPGAVSLTLDAEGEASPYYADGIVYFRTLTNNGYSGDLEIALITDWFRENVLKETKDSNGVFIETTDNVEPVYFAMLFEFDGDQKAIRHVLYNCSVSTRPTLESSTKEDTIEPGSETLSISADPREDGLVKARSGDDTTSAVYNAWYDAVPSVSYASLSALSIGTLSLTPTFSAGTTSYTANTGNASDVVTATGANGASVTIDVNGSTVQSGSAATWNSGSNTVTVTVTKSGLTTREYTVTVTKAAG